MFGNTEITKNADPSKYSYSGYGIGFDSSSIFSIPNFDWENMSYNLMWAHLWILIIRKKMF